MEFLDFAKKRYSCRSMDGREIAQEDLDKIIEAAMVAPTSINGQPFKVFVMKSQHAKEVLRDAISNTYGANTYLVVGAATKTGPVRKSDSFNFPLTDATIAATHMMLEVEDLGLATTWIGAFDPIALYEAFPEMKDYALVGIFPIGYATTDAVPSKMHTKSKTKDQLVVEL